MQILMSGTVIVLCTCGSEEEAERIADALVTERLAACVNVLPPMRSVYRWEGQVETASEILLVIKTTALRFDALRDRIQDLHSYDTPEIVMLHIEGGSEKYIKWLGEQV